MTTKNGRAERLAFSTSRMMEYVSEKELTAQIGFGRSRWPVALVKELIDNALDACEAAGLPPAVNVARGGDYFVVEDNGPGIPPELVTAALDFGTRTSSNSRYVGPTRGQLGNALKCVFAAPAVLFPGQGAGVTVTACGVEHRVLIAPDPIAQGPRIDHQQRPFAKNGTSVRVDWPGLAGLLDEDAEGDFYKGRVLGQVVPALLRSFAVLNPDAAIALDGETILPPAALRKWRGCDRTCAHWYSVRNLADLIAAHVHRERQGLARPRSLRDFVTNFDKLSGSGKAPAVLGEAGLTGKRLSDMVSKDGGLDMAAVGRLWAAMRRATAAPLPKALGVIGKARMAEAVCRVDGADPDTFRYQLASGTDDGGRPYVFEVALAVLNDHERVRVTRYGVNWSPAIDAHDELIQALHEADVDHTDPVTVTAHFVTPRAAYTDLGKARSALPRQALAALRSAVARAAERWTKAKRRQAREERRLRADQIERLARQAPKGLTIRQAAFAVMAEAHAHVVGGRAGAPAHARQIMYRARKLIQRFPGVRCWKRSGQFTQGFLPDYVEEHPQETAGWNVVYDARGELIEPHGGRAVPLGTLQVREYIASLVGGRPLDRYRHVLLIEKEGFRDLIEYFQIAERYDVALAWTKGMSTTAARELVDGLSGLGVTTLVLHDFDVSGLAIAHTIAHSSKRYRFRNEPLVRDVGLRLADVEALCLEGEEVEYLKRKKDPRVLLAQRGVPQAERDYLVRAVRPSFRGRRVELNELSNDQFITLIEAKLAEAGVKKVVPGEDRLRAAFEHQWRSDWITRAVEEATRRAREEAEKLAPPTPADLAGLVRRRIEGTADDWRRAVELMVAGSVGNTPRQPT